MKKAETKNQVEKVATKKVNLIATKKESTKKLGLENIIVLNDDDKKAKAKEKRLLNPQFSHLVSKAKKQIEKDYKSNAIKVLIGCKTIIDTIESKDYNLYENQNLISKCKSFVNYVTAKDKKGDFKNDAILSKVLNNVRTTKSGLYNEYYFAQIVQKIVKTSIDKDIDFMASIRLIESKK